MPEKHSSEALEASKHAHPSNQPAPAETVPVNPYVFKHESLQPSKRVTVTTVPPLFATALDGQWEFVKRDQISPYIELADAKEAAFHLAYAKAWGMSKPEGHQVTVKKAPVRKGDTPGTLRLIMEPYDPNAPKRGRKPATATASE